jgi:hypothetical protein
MNLDLIEIGLSYITDNSTFEKLASEVMREEGYHDIKPLGGVNDQGQDAYQEKFYYRMGLIRTVFQYTLQDYVEGKFRDTIDILGTIHLIPCTKNKKNQMAGEKSRAGITVISRSLRAVAADWRPNSVR